MPTLASSSPFLPSLSNDPLVFGVSLATGFVLGVLTHRYVFAWIHPSLLLGLKEKKKRFITSHASSSNSSTTTTTTTKPAVGSGSYSSLLSETSESILSQDSEPSSSSSVSTRKPQKMVFVVRTDLGMGKGKIASQCCHACLAAYEQATTMIPKAVRAWKLQGQTKVALKCDSEAEMLEIENKAISLNLPAESILDAGRTQIQAGTRTVLAIGPASVECVDQVTGHLKLL